MGRCITATRRWPRDQKSKPEVNLRDVIKWRSEAHVRRSQWLSRIFEPNFIQSSSTALVTWRNVPNLHDLKIQEGGGRRLGFRKMSITPNWIESYFRKIWWADASRPCAADTWPKLETRTFFCVTSLLWWIKMYISNECREHKRCAHVKAYKSSQLTDL